MSTERMKLKCLIPDDNECNDDENDDLTVMMMMTMTIGILKMAMMTMMNILT